MIYLVDERNQPAYQSYIREFASASADSAAPPSPVEPGTDNSRPASTYLLGIDDTGRLTSGVRAEPLTSPLKAAGNVLLLAQSRAGNRACEFHGWFVAPTDGPVKNHYDVAGRLLVASLEYALSLGYVGANLRFTPSLSAITERLGFSDKRRPENETFSLWLDVSHGAADAVREFCHVRGPVLHYSPTPPSAVVTERAQHLSAHRRRDTKRDHD